MFVIAYLSSANAIANVALKGEKTHPMTESVAAATPKLTKEDASAKAEADVGGKYNNWPNTLEYFVKDSDHVVLTHVVQVRKKETQEWYKVFVDAHSGEIVNVVSFVAHSSYRVVPFHLQSPNDGFQNLTNLYDTISSLNGWHQYGTTTTTVTSGNNVPAYKGSPSNGTTPQSSATNNYVYAFDTTRTPAESKDPAVVNVFYIGNMMHNLLYRYGFTETAYNFQRNNNGKGGAENDHVLISVQDIERTDNASFATPADGESGELTIYIWTRTNPNREGALDNDIVVHEYTHGLTNRLTGGGTASCLQTFEASSLGEGWSDTITDWTESNSATARDFTLGTYVNATRNSRHYPYSISKATNMIFAPLIAKQ